jgi:hypothetical protein
MALDDLYSDYGINYAGKGERHFKNGWLNCACPYCSSGGDGNHLGFHLQAQYFFCWKCGKHQITDTIMKLVGVSRYQAESLVRDYRIHITKKSSLQTRNDAGDSRIGLVPFAFPTNIRKLQKVHRKYLEKRNFDPDELVEKWFIRGTSPNSFLKGDDFTIAYKYRILIPFYWNDEVVSYQCRDFTEKQDPKYMACPMSHEKVHHKHILYGNQEEWTDVGILTEGVFDVWRLGGRAAATLGIQYTDEQLIVMKQAFKRVHVLFDPGSREKREAVKTVARLRAIGVEAYSHLDLPSDPGDMSQTEADYLMKQLT